MRLRSGVEFDVVADADRAAYDIAGFWARSGIAASLTTPGQHPPFQRGGMGDHNAGLACAAGVSAALYSREKTGKGQLVSTSLLREGIYTLSFDLALGARFGVPLQVAERAAMGNPCINNYADSEGRWFWIVGLEAERHFGPLARAVGRPEWIDDERFSTAPARAENARELIAALDAIFETKPRDEWAEIFDAEEDLWWAPVQTTQEVLADPQVHAAGGLVEVPDGSGTTLLPATRSTSPGHPGPLDRWRPSTASTATKFSASSAGRPTRSQRCATAVPSAEAGTKPRDAG